MGQLFGVFIEILHGNDPLDDDIEHTAVINTDYKLSINKYERNLLQMSCYEPQQCAGNSTCRRM